MTRDKDSEKYGLNQFYDLIRDNVGYGRVFSKYDLVKPMACNHGIRLSEGRGIDDMLELFVKFNFVKSFDEKGEQKYLLLRVDDRKAPITGSWSRKK